MAMTVDPRLGFFITMNPGYAGRQELPENLKALFRTVAMMVPTAKLLFAFSSLRRGTRRLRSFPRSSASCMASVRSSYRHSVTTTLVSGTSFRAAHGRDQPSRSSHEKGPDRNNLEEMLMMRTIRDMNLAKLVADDVGLFISLLADLFPKQSLQRPSGSTTRRTWRRSAKSGASCTTPRGRQRRFSYMKHRLCATAS